MSFMSFIFLCQFSELQIAECHFAEQQHQFLLFLATPFGEMTFCKMSAHHLIKSYPNFVFIEISFFFIRLYVYRRSTRDQQWSKTY